MAKTKKQKQAEAWARVGAMKGNATIADIEKAKAAERERKDAEAKVEEIKKQLAEARAAAQRVEKKTTPKTIAEKKAAAWAKLMAAGATTVTPEDLAKMRAAQDAVNAANKEVAAIKRELAKERAKPTAPTKEPTRSVIRDEESTVGTSLRINVSTATVQAILDSIRAVDGAEAGVELSKADYPLQAVKEYATEPVYKTLANGKRVKVRGPLADSLEDYLHKMVRVGKVKWEAVLDENTGELDRSLNGTIWDADDPARPISPLHPNCRCRVVPITGAAYK